MLTAQHGYRIAVIMNEVRGNYSALCHDSDELKFADSADIEGLESSFHCAWKSHHFSVK